MNRGIVILSVLLVLGLGWAYAVSHPSSRKASRAEESVQVWKVDPATVTALVYENDGFRVEVSRQDDGVWVSGEEPGKASKRRINKGEEAPEEEEAPPPPQPFGFLGNPSASALLTRFSNLEARRRVGDISGLDAEAFGLAAPTQFLELHPGEGEPLRLALGGSNFGGEWRYVQNLRDNQVYLLAQTDFRELDQAPRRLVERDLWPFPLADAKRIVVTGPEESLTLHRLDVRPGAPDMWGFRADQEEGEESLQNLVNSLTRLKVHNYEGEPGAPLPDDAKNLLQVQVFTEGEAPAAWLRVAEGPRALYIAQTGYNKTTFTLRRPVVRPVMDNLKKILQAQ